MKTGVDLLEIIEQFVDYLMPDLTPYETSLYLYMLRNSHIKNDRNEIRVGKRTIASGYGKGSRGVKTNYEHVTEVIKRLELHECISIGDTNREGTLYFVRLPKDVPLVALKLADLTSQNSEEDFFNNPEKRILIFKRDKWICQYCGEKVLKENATIDHYIPQVKGGKHNKDNLRTCCLVCNAIKSGKTYDEAVPYLLKSIQERRSRTHEV
jgi:hypothetical protein